jgi:hypothetical protein
MEDLSFDEALDVLQIQREYALLVLHEDGTPLLSAWGNLDSVQGDYDDFAVVLLGPEKGPRLDLRRNEVSRIQYERGSGSIMYDLVDGIRIVLAAQATT